MAPTNLLNTWGSCTIFGFTYPSLAAHNWQSRTATNGGGYFKLLLATEDTAGNVYYDTQKIWIDNHSVIAKIVKFQREINGVWTDIPNCTDVMLSWKKLRIIGIAWDALINPAYPIVPPNDNFKSYELSYTKQFVGGSVTFMSSNPRVPSPLIFPLIPPFPLTGSIPIAPANADILAEWDLSTLDAGPTILAGCPNPIPDAAHPKAHPNQLYRKCECTYTIVLRVSDSTKGSELWLHDTSDTESLKIINDL